MTTVDVIVDDGTVLRDVTLNIIRDEIIKALTPGPLYISVIEGPSSNTMVHIPADQISDTSNAAKIDAVVPGVVVVIGFAQGLNWAKGSDSEWGPLFTR